MPDSSPTSTPKRKRGEEAPLTPIKFSFGLDKEEPSEDGSSSPRSSVAHRFRGLGLEGSGGGVHLDAPASPGGISKRFKPESDVLPSVSDFACRESIEDGSPTRGKPGVTLQSGPPPSQALPENPAVPSPSKAKGKKRAGTPPLRVKKSPVHEKDHDSEEDENDEAEIVDPVRAALTWHDDEITVYDPDDEDDDGTGINGVGFKPTPAMAHARAMKRRQQMAEYRKREESDARMKRSQRRKGDGEPSTRIDKASARRVRFSEAERRNIAVTTR